MNINVTTVKSLTDDLFTVYNGLRNKTIKPAEVHESTATAGKIFSGVRAQLQYNKMTGTTPDPAQFQE